MSANLNGLIVPPQLTALSWPESANAKLQDELGPLAEPGENLTAICGTVGFQPSTLIVAEAVHPVAAGERLGALPTDRDPGVFCVGGFLTEEEEAEILSNFDSEESYCYHVVKPELSPNC